MEPFGNPELRLKKYCKYALNGNKSISANRQTSNPQVRVPAQKQQVVNPLKPFVSLPKTNKGEQLPPLADETSVARCLTTALA